MTTKILTLMQQDKTTKQIEKELFATGATKAQINKAFDEVKDTNTFDVWSHYQNLQTTPAFINGSFATMIKVDTCILSTEYDETLDVESNLILDNLEAYTRMERFMRVRGITLLWEAKKSFFFNKIYYVPVLELTDTNLTYTNLKEFNKDFKKGFKQVSIIEKIKVFNYLFNSGWIIQDVYNKKELVK